VRKLNSDCEMQPRSYCGRCTTNILCNHNCTLCNPWKRWQ